MQVRSDDLARAVRAREEAGRRIRVATAVMLAAAVCLAGLFAALAATTTHAARRIVRHTEARSSRRLPPLTQAPAPPLVSAQAPAPSEATPAPPASAPTPSAAPPVVASGGS
jgi:hypothetical protein